MNSFVDVLRALDSAPRRCDWSHIGLIRGFLYAGARSIVASLWEVETRKNYPHPMYWAAFQIIGRAD